MAIMIKKDNNVRWDNNENSSNTKLTLSDGNIRFYNSPPPNSKLMFKKDKLGWGNDVIHTDSIMFSYSYKRFESGPHPGSFDLKMAHLNASGNPILSYNMINLKVTGPYNSMIKKYSEIGYNSGPGRVVFQGLMIAANDPNHEHPIIIADITIRNAVRIIRVNIEFDSGITYLGGSVTFIDNTTIQIHPGDRYL